MLSLNNYSMRPVHFRNKVTCLMVLEQPGRIITHSKNDDFPLIDTEKQHESYYLAHVELEPFALAS